MPPLRTTATATATATRGRGASKRGGAKAPVVRGGKAVGAKVASKSKKKFDSDDDDDVINTRVDEALTQQDAAPPDLSNESDEEPSRAKRSRRL